MRAKEVVQETKRPDQASRQNDISSFTAFDSSFCTPEGYASTPIWHSMRHSGVAFSCACSNPSGLLLRNGPISIAFLDESALSDQVVRAGTVYEIEKPWVAR